MKTICKMLCGIALTSAFSMNAVQARELRAAENQPLDFPTTMYVKKIGEIISQKTSGKYSIKVFGNSALGSEKDTVEQTKIGALFQSQWFRLSRLFSRIRRTSGKRCTVPRVR